MVDILQIYLFLLGQQPKRDFEEPCLQPVACWTSRGFENLVSVRSGHEKSCADSTCPVFLLELRPEVNLAVQGLGRGSA